MARVPPTMPSHVIIFGLLFSFCAISTLAEKGIFAKTIDKNSIDGFEPQFVTHVRVYWHDIVGGRNPTAIPVVPPRANSSTAFGLISMIDDPLTLGPELTSKLVGRAQGFYASASQQRVGLTMVMNFAFTDGTYKDSTISIFGRNEVFSNVREMPIIGGSGKFRFARGYVQARTYKFDPKTGDATVEYNCYITH